MTIPSLESELLYVVVFGPGYGESVVLKLPPQSWVVVDSCTIAGRPPALQLLAENGAQCSCVLLTHPHLDHTAGMDLLLEAHGQATVGCYDPFVTDPKRWRDSPDPEENLRKGVLEQVVAVMNDRQDSDAESMWNLHSGASRSFGDARLTALHPEEGSVVGPSDDLNCFSTPILVEWEHVRILLGADLPTREWDTMSSDWRFLDRHALLKVPHHGSRGSLSDRFTGEGASKDRLWIATPFNRGRKLPSFEDDDGIHLMLRHVKAIHLTGLPAAHDLQGTAPCHAKRADLRDGRSPSPMSISYPGGLVADYQPELSSPMVTYVAAGFDKDGNLAELHHGLGAVEVTE